MSKKEPLELLEPGNTNLTAPEQCVYRQGRILHDEGLNSKHMLNILELANRESKRAIISSFERMWIFSQGLDGKKLEKRGSKNYCAEKCELEKCEYK